ncbi:MAG: GNAT family N-acetyltransferase [Flavobacteriales bacterium]|nr:GNAT family N-acetyltransferase [Flavobacteriales bacterium]
MPTARLAATTSEPADHRAEVQALTLSIHDSIHLVHRSDWGAVAMSASPFLGYGHLSALEDAMRGRMDFRYVLFHGAKYKPVGIACFQILDFEDNGSAQSQALCRIGAGLEARVRKELKVRSLVCGNVFHCGDHGSHFIDTVGREQQLLALEMAMEQLRADERLQPKISALMFKEFWPEQNGRSAVLRDKGYYMLATDVNMVMDIDPAWKDLDGYQAALTSKARTRIKSILRRSAAMEIRDLSEAEIRGSLPALQRLFDEVLQRSPFIFGRLQVGVYAQWKALHAEQMMFRGYFLEGELVGFSAAFTVGNTLDAQFVGIDYARNQEHGIYLRMLVDLLDLALRKRLGRLDLGRTAEQAKSTIGARPVQMLVHVKHRNRVANRLIGPFIRKVKHTAFEERSPFRK